MLTIIPLRLLLASAGLTLLLASAAHAQNPVVPGQSPLRRLTPSAGQPPGAAAPGVPTPGGRGLDSLRTLSGRYHKLEAGTPTLVLFDVTVGFAHPVGSFAASPTDGAALNGGSLSVGAAYLFTRYLGVFGSLGGSIHGVRDEAVANRLGLTPQNATNIAYGKAGWSQVAFLVGPQLTLPLGRPGGLALDVRPGVGLTYVVAPRYGATFTDTGTGMQQHQYLSSAAAFAVAYQVGANLRIPLSERLGLRLGADYFYTRPSLDDYDPTTSIVLNDSHTRRTVAYFQVVAGLVIKFE